MRKITTILALALTFTILLLPLKSFADAVEGDVIITLGENLTQDQKEQILNEMAAPENVTIITVSNQEEHKYLDAYIPKAEIGTRAISSSKITIGKENSGLSVKTNNINWVTEEMYTNALITAGVKDAEIYITAPFPVSGTAALTGIMKAYEVTANEAIPEDVKKVANEEMVKTAKLAESVGTDQAAALIAKVKDEMAKNAPKNDEELRKIIEDAAKDLGITLSENDIQSLIALFNKMKNLNIDWNQVEQQMQNASEKISKFLKSEEGQSFIQKAKEFFISLINAIKSIFAQ